MTTREQKAEQIAELQALLRSAAAVAFTDYRGFTVAELREVRSQLRSHNVRFVVAKNTLTRLALQRNQQPINDGVLAGPTALAVFQEDLVGPAKALVDLNRARKPLGVKGLLLGQSFGGPEGLQKLASIPARDQLYGQVVGQVASPLTGLLGVLQGTVSGLVYVLQARTRQLESVSGAPS
ncbi:MAG: 50S ribosomal protein L10 [Chloroflexi bacterium]|nr:50S ribosomal protein L10 [Chloroflexota bacterium]